MIFYRMKRKALLQYFSKYIPATFMLAAISLSAVSCNEKTTDEPETDETETIISLPNVAVSSFSLKGETGVMSHLDSVFFSVDLENGVIFNADSLPKGAKIDKLVATIKYSDYITSAKIIMDGGTTRRDTIDYIKHAGDSIDFTGNVRLVIATEKEEMKKTYTIKVNVHKENPDSLVWTEMAQVPLPSRFASPVTQKSVELDNKAISIIQENDGSYTLAATDDLYANSWTKEELSLPFTPDIRSLAASENNLFMLDNQGALYSSPDGKSWTATGQTWARIIGGYSDTVLGLAFNDTGLVYAQYPIKDLNVISVDSDFPINDISNFATHTNKWSSNPIGFFCGGVLSDGTLSDAAWAFDGSNWIALSKGNFPTLKGASLVPYHAFRATGASGITPVEIDAWFVIGGQLADGSFNRCIYISYDNGVNWKRADSELSLPPFIPALTSFDNIVMASSKESNITDAWTTSANIKRPRVSWSVDGDMLKWECPYIYLIGGFDNNMILSNTMWRGVINRLASAPII